MTSETWSAFVTGAPSLPTSFASTDEIAMVRGGATYHLPPTSLFYDNTILCYLPSGATTLVARQPSGSIVNMAGTATMGLQEALNAAASLKTKFRLIGPASISIPTGGITIPASFQGDYQFDRSASITFNAPGATPLVTIDSQENSKIIIECGLVQGAGGTGHSVYINPLTALSTGNTVFTANTLVVSGCTPQAAGDGVYFNIASHEARGNHIVVFDVNGGTWVLQVSDPGALTTFSGNQIWMGGINHGQTSGGAKVGVAGTNQANLRDNKWYYGTCEPNNAAAVLHDTFESSSFILFSGTDGTFGSTYNLRAGGSGNVLFLTSNAHAGTDSGSTNTVFSAANVFTSATFNLATVIAHKLTQWAGNSTTFIQSGGSLTRASPQLTPAGVPATTAETTLQQFTVPAGVMSSAGQSIKIKAWGTYLSNADTKRMRLYYGTNAVYDTTALTLNAGAGQWLIEAEVLNTTGVTTQTTIGNAMFGLSASTAPQITATSENPGSNVVVKVTGQNGTGTLNNIVCNGLTVEVVP